MTTWDRAVRNMQKQSWKTRTNPKNPRKTIKIYVLKPKKTRNQLKTDQNLSPGYLDLLGHFLLFFYSLIFQEPPLVGNHKKLLRKNYMVYTSAPGLSLKTPMCPEMHLFFKIPNNASILCRFFSQNHPHFHRLPTSIGHRFEPSCCVKLHAVVVGTAEIHRLKQR